MIILFGKLLNKMTRVRLKNFLLDTVSLLSGTALIQHSVALVNFLTKHSRILMAHDCLRLVLVTS